MFAQNLTKDTLGAEESNPRDHLRLYTIRKEGNSYTVVVKPVKTSQKTFYLKGYLTHECAERDVPRLVMHFRTGRVLTFVKNTGEEYDMTPPSKKRKGETIHIVSTVKELRGNCFKQLCRRLKYSYYRYRTEANCKDSPRLSKTRWMKQQSLKNVDDNCNARQADLEQDVRTESALSYLHQRLQLLENRRRANDKVLKGLRECIYTGTCYKKIREYISEKDKAENIIDLTDDGPAFTQETTSRSQLTRVTLQCFVTYNTMQRLESRDSDEIKMLSGVLQEATHIIGSAEERKNLPLLLSRYDADKSAFRLNNSISKISDDVRFLSGDHISSRTIRVWYNEYIEKQSFQEDCRGTHERTSFIEDYGYCQRFKLYLKNEKKLTVDAATRELEDIIRKDPPASVQGKKMFESLRPFSRRTVHRWMQKLGCKYDKATISYYTDTHEAEETKKDFRERYVVQRCMKLNVTFDLTSALLSQVWTSANAARAQVTSMDRDSAVQGYRSCTGQ